MDDMIRLADVRFRWRRRSEAVLDIARFSVAPGERVFLSGPSGSGKSTLLNLLGGVAVADTGRVEVLGTDLASLPARGRDRFRSDHVGFVFQMFNLLPFLPLVANVTLPCLFSPVRRARAEARTGSADAEAARLLAAMGLAREVIENRATSDLSVGQQQRVAAARALIGAPELIVADEPTSALDTEVRRAFLDLLFAEVANAGSTLLFVSHDGSLADRFDRAVRLSDINAVVTRRESAA
jgi:putative ABC transport system ATP-binding protein